MALPLCAAGFETYLLSLEKIPNMRKVKQENPRKLILARLRAS
jgi:hypothetical protein